jgi:hypothetical protein
MLSRRKATTTEQEGIVFANTSCRYGFPDGLTYRLIAGQPWAADDPLVAANPGMFGADPPWPFPMHTVG